MRLMLLMIPTPANMLSITAIAVGICSTCQSPCRSLIIVWVVHIYNPIMVASMINRSETDRL